MSTEQNNGKPAVPPKRNLLNDRRIRLLLSLLGAVIAWMAVTIVVQPGTTTTIYNVPVDFSYDSAAYTSRGLSIVNAEEKTVNLKLSGDGYTIGSLSANDFVVYPDWSSVRDSGEKSLRLQVRSQSTLLTGVSVSIDGDNTVDVVVGYLPAQAEVLGAQALAERLTQPRQQAQPAIEALLQVLEPAQELPRSMETLRAEAQAIDQDQGTLPLLTVCTVEEVTYTQPVEPPVQEVEDSTLLLGEEKVPFPRTAITAMISGNWPRPSTTSTETSTGT